MQKYDFKSIEKKWQDKWETSDYAKAKNDPKKEKKFILDMFPYPSGAGLHMGHMENYTATDIYSRYLRMNGYDVMHPMGWDAFGLPAENYAIKTGIHPQIQTPENIATFIRQIKSLGFAYDWSREIDTSTPEYYKWTQWFFLFLYENGLAYKKKAKVNWCNSCQTVLANEQAEGGTCERCQNEVIQKDLEQWFFKITDFAEDLINGLDTIDWPSSTIAAQKNWIGKSEGVEFDIKIKDSAEVIKVYTTRIDTVFGMTYVVISPESEIIKSGKLKIENQDEVNKYIKETSKKTELERTQLNKEKTGVELKGIVAINPFNNKEVKVFIGDYVLANYGTGAVMAVPAHDERDFEFAKKYNLEIKQSITTIHHVPEGKEIDWIYDFGKLDKLELVCTYDGTLIDSGEFTGLTSEVARAKMGEKVEKEKIGTRKINYKLRDWLISRQRYWGSPIPIIYCDSCGEVKVPLKDLPVLLPTDVDFKPTGESPLVNSKTFHDVKCPICGKSARRESDTMDTFVCSSWYYLRFSDPHNDEVFASKECIEKWLPVDMYMGGAEHTVLHLLYARFFTKALQKYGHVKFNEPFTKLRHQGTVLAEDGRKMSKSLGNVVNPDSVSSLYGADTTRLYSMFLGALEDIKPWNSQNIIGTKRFLDKVWSLQDRISPNAPITNEIEVLLNKTIKKVDDDIKTLGYNTAISALMILTNALDKLEQINQSVYEKLLKILSPLAPFITEELWSLLGHKESIHLESWPTYDNNKLVDAVVTIAIQVNGKLRDTIEVEFDSPEEVIKEKALAKENVIKHLEGKEIRKIVYVKNKLLSVVV